MGSAACEQLADIAEQPEVGVVERLVGRRQAAASGGVIASTSRFAGQQGAELGQAAAAGGTDAPDGHAERGGHRA